MPTVLVVDDESAIRRDRRSDDHRGGVSRVDGHEWRDALDTLRTSGPVDVLLSDLRMALMNGAQLAAEVLRRHPTVSVVLMAAYPSVDPLDWPVVVKPFPLEVLEAEVWLALKRTRRAPQLR